MNEYITIVRNNDTDFNGGKLATINFQTEILDLSNFKAVLVLDTITKTFNDLSSGTVELNLTATETKSLPTFFNGVLQFIDLQTKKATFESIIPFRVINEVHGNAIATEPYTLNFDVKQGGETILTVNVESAVSVEVGQTTTLPAGSDATVENVGTLNHLVLDFGIPQGIQGEQGETGADGQSAIITGATATVNNTVGTPSVTVTSGGTELARSFNFDFKNLKGEQGIQGIQGISGQDGTNATITGVTASVSNTVGIPNVVVTAGGTESARSFNFAFTNIKGEKGDTGSDAEVTQANVLAAIGYTPEQSSTIQNLSATDSITLADNTIYNGGTQTALTITLPLTVDISFLCEIDFTSGTTATTFSAPNTIKWLGDDVSSNVFTPTASKRYTVIIYYDGAEYVGVVKGVE